MKSHNHSKLSLTLCKKYFSFVCLTAILLCLSVVAATAQDEVVWEQSYSYGAGGVADFGPSQKAGSTAYTLDRELADDINMTGTISRVDVQGYSGGPVSLDPASSYYFGVNVRFYAFGADNKPGALQAEYFIPKNSPNMLYQSSGLGDLRVRLEPAFQAVGKHFITVQAVLDPQVIPGSGGGTANWYWRSSNADTIREEAFYFRANPVAAWGRDAENDGSRNLSMRVWGTRTLTIAPTISQISANTLAQAGRIKITGTNFGNTQGTGTILISGAAAIVSRWTETAIIAYIPDASTIGEGDVKIITQGGTSNAKPFTVRARPSANGRVKWRFQADDLYIQGRPAVGADGTVYALGVGGRLYALTPDGGLKWIFQGDFPAVQSVSVGADNTIYFAGFNKIYAVNADGTLKWRIVNTSGGSFNAGPNVGPDGNIYAVAGLADPNNLQLGAITISPAGEILKNRQGYLEGEGSSSGSREIVFGSNQFYFGGLNNFVFGTSGLDFLQLGGTYIRTVSAGGGQPAVAPDGTIYDILGGNPGTPSRLGAFSPTSGALLRTILTTETYLTTPDIGADGTLYATHNLSKLSAYTPDGAKLWDFTGDSQGYFGSAIVNQQNTVVTAGISVVGDPGFIHGISTGNGQALWTINLPAENGGYVRAISRARFTPDGSTVYYGTDVNDYANDAYSYLYAVSSAPSVPCSTGITPDFASYQYNGGSGIITVASTNNNCVWTATSNVNWITVYNAGGTGNGTVAYTVTANPNFASRTGTLTVGGQTFTVTQGARTTTTSVNITSPGSGEVFTLPTNIFVSANATNTNGTIARVEFYANNQLIGTDTSAPYQIVWNDTAATNYTLVAKSIDQNGAVTLSEAVNITIYPVPGPEPAPLPIPPPTLTSPTAGQEFNAGESVTFAAQPGASQYTIDRVEFYLDATLVGSDDTSPYSFTLNNIPGGIYSVSARTVAGTGAQATSQPVDIRVNANRISAGAKPFDFDGDGKSDISVFRPGNGTWYLQQSTSGFTGVAFGVGTDKLAPADYDGDGKADVAVVRNGTWYLQRSQLGFTGITFGDGNDIPVPADYDGDGKADIAVFRPSNGVWYIQRSQAGFIGIAFGASGDKPVAADYDGDGKTDIAVFRPSNGVWYLQRSQAGFTGVAFGDANDKPVAADYDGDGKADIAVFRPSNGTWYLQRSQAGFTGIAFGAGTDIPSPADFDGDGKADVAVFRNGTWYLQRSAAGFTGIQFGAASDIPVSSVFTR